MSASASSSNAPQPLPVVNAAEAHKTVTHLLETMDSLLAILEQETDLVRAGRLADATTLQPRKSELARLYIADTLRLRHSQERLSALVPDLMATLRERHEVFRSQLQINLTVLATAHAVSEGIVRGVSGDLARKAAPHVYGRTGQAAPLPLSAAQPLAVSRTL